MQAEIVIVGTEFLLGKREDSNAAYLVQQLTALALDLYCKTTVGDDERRVTSILQQALARSDVVITSGGLSPENDVTRRAVARVAGRELVLDGKVLAQIELGLARGGLAMNDNYRRQAYIPQGAIPIENPLGITPAFIVETEQGLIISLPGVQRELEYLMEIRVIPFLRERLQMDQIVATAETPLALPDVTWMEKEVSTAYIEEIPTGPGLKLIIQDGGGEIEVPSKEEVSMGRLDPASGSFPDIDLSNYGAVEKGVSRRHAKIIKRGEEFVIEDLGSINGTFLNGKKLQPYVFEALKDGDELHLGKLVLRVNFV